MWERREKGQSQELWSCPKEKGGFAWWPGGRQVFLCFSVWQNVKGRVARESPAPRDGVCFWTYDSVSLFGIASLMRNMWRELHSVLGMGWCLGWCVTAVETVRRKWEENKAVFWLLESAMFCTDLHFPILFLPPQYWGNFCSCTSAHYSDPEHYCLCHTSTPPLSLDFAEIWPHECSLQYKSFWETQNINYVVISKSWHFLRLILGLIDWPKTTEPTDPEKLLLIWRSMAGCIYYQENPCSS